MARVAREQSTNALNLIQETRRLVDIGRTAGGGAKEGELTALLDEAVERVGPIAKARPLKVRREFPATKASVQGPDLLREVFVNLLHNAVKFDSHDEVILDLAVHKHAAEGKAFWRVRVADRGAGVPDKDLPRLFDRGFRPSSAPARSGDAIAPVGSGIGLSLCRFIVERAGGQIYAESRIPGDPKQGTAFVVLLPAA
jgi:signal transduction histidine kinase